MAKIEIKVLHDLHVCSWIKHKLCAELLFVLGAFTHKQQVKEQRKR